MVYYENETKQKMSNSYGDMTPVERSIADFFLSNAEKMDFSSKNISKRLYVSEAALSRFAKKCGYRGYRELIFSYEKDLESEVPKENTEQDVSSFTKKIRGSYASLLNESFNLLKEKQIRKVTAMLDTAKKICVYGMGSSGFVAKEFQLRFMRIGLTVEAFTDSQMMQMNAALADSETLVIGLSLSGRTKEVNHAVRLAKKKGAAVVYLTANEHPEVADCCGELVQTAYMKNLDTGTRISPQITLLVMLDVIYSYYFSSDTYYKVKKYKQTLAAIRGEEVEADEEKV